MKLVFCWHMHQPDYRDSRSGQYQLPWTYLHAIKDYVDMVAHFENNPQAKAVVNFAPILLDQIDDYAQQIRGYFEDNTLIKDSVLNALIDPTLSPSVEYRHSLIKSCMRANEKNLIARFEPFQRLVRLGEWLDTHPDYIYYYNNQFFVDLFVWYHLAWLGETLKLGNQQVKELIDKESGYTLHDRRDLLRIIGDTIASLIPRYRLLMERGQIELSLSPYAHPIVPLLIDVDCARQAVPEIPLPLVTAYPNGYERAKWHLEEGIKVFENYFGSKPAGCWLSEGGVSDASLRLAEELGFVWTASGENVLSNTLRQQKKAGIGHKSSYLYRPYNIKNGQLCCFFRDDELSDLIGFTYSEWHGDDAVANLVSRLETIASSLDHPDDATVSIILDGENAWEYYPNNGYHFLSALYKTLADHPDFELTTFSKALGKPDTVGKLSTLVAGSWVYGTFSTWIGDEQKNRAWDMLTEAKRCYDNVMAGNSLNEQQRIIATHQLATCESSDWFWWFGDINPSDTVADFDRLFRMNLSNLYLYLAHEPPNYLTEYFAHGGGSPTHGGVMKTGSSS